MNTIQYHEQLVIDLFDAQPQPVFWMKPVWDSQGLEVTDFEYAYCNQEFYHILPVTPAQIIGSRISNSPLLNAELKERYLKQFTEVLRTGKKVDDTVYNPVLDTYFSFLRSRVQDGVLTVIQDRTREYKMIGELEQATGQLRSYINASQSAMSLFRPLKNAAGEVVDFTFGTTNNAFAGYAGQTPETVAGDPVSKWYPTYLDNGLFHQYRHTQQTGETVRREFHYFGDGVDAWFDIMSTKMLDGVLVTLTDLTTVKKLQLELERSVTALRSSNEQLEGFAYAASHDLKEPIRKIHFFANRLKTALADRMTADEAGLFGRMEASAQRMQVLVHDLLAYSHVAYANQPRELIHLGEKVRLVLEDLELPISEKGAVVEVADLPSVWGYRRQLQQLFHNLIGNALKYSKPGVAPRLDITSRVVTGSAVHSDLPPETAGKAFHLVRVQDNGIGFEQKYARRIFGMFQRLHGRAEYSGTGVGLSIVRRAVDNHGGYIWAESAPGEGATFNVLLPMETD